MAKTLIYFVSDLHGSSVCFRKFINASRVYKPSVMVLGGDLAGKAIQSIVRQPNGLWKCTFIGTDYELDDGPDLVALEKLIADHGYYPYRAEPGELEAMEAEGKLDELFLRLMRERLTEWLQIANERLRPLNLPLYLMLGNDDPPPLKQLLIDAPWGTHAEGEVLWIDDEHEMISWGFPNTTPWHTYREQTEDQLGGLSPGSPKADATRPIFNVHAPPYDTQLDDAPKLDATFRAGHPRPGGDDAGGQHRGAPGGARPPAAARPARPHPRSSSGVRRLGRSMVLNPGSDYSTGALNGALVTISDKVTRATSSSAADRHGGACTGGGRRPARRHRRRHLRRACLGVHRRRRDGARGARALSTLLPREGWAEQDADRWRSRGADRAGTAGARPRLAAPHPRRRAHRPVSERRSGGRA